MGHGKPSLELIPDKFKLKKTFQKRKKGLVKKISDLCILCGADASMIIHAPKMMGKQQPAKLETWPQNPADVYQTIRKYQCKDKNLIAKGTNDLSNFFDGQTKEVKEQIKKVRKDIFKAKYPTWDHRFDHLSEDQLRALLQILDIKILGGIPIDSNSNSNSMLELSDQKHINVNTQFPCEFSFDQASQSQPLQQFTVNDPKNYSSQGDFSSHQVHGSQYNYFIDTSKFQMIKMEEGFSSQLGHGSSQHNYVVDTNSEFQMTKMEEGFPTMQQIPAPLPVQDQMMSSFWSQMHGSSQHNCFVDQFQMKNMREVFPTMQQMPLPGQDQIMSCFSSQMHGSGTSEFQMTNMQEGCMKF